MIFSLHLGVGHSALLQLEGVGHVFSNHHISNDVEGEEIEEKSKENQRRKRPIERAHRVGKPRSDGKPGPIIAKFSFFKGKSYVLSKAPNLAGTNFECLQTSQKKLVTSGNRSYHI